MTIQWKAVLGAAALAAAGTGCASLGGGNQSKSDTRAAQASAGQHFQNAADAQKAAQEEQQKAEKSDQEVAEAQKALAEAQARSSGQHAKAEAAQSTARQLAQGATQQAHQEQQHASTAMQRETSEQQKLQGSRESWRDQKTVSGRVVEASGSTLRLRSSSQGDMNLSLSETTALRVNGQAAKSEQILPGDEVRASYQMVDGKPTAVRIDVRSHRSLGSGSTSTDSSASGSSGSTGTGTGTGTDTGAKTPSTDSSTGTQSPPPPR
jgi:multidrug efflux pump subunit AcrA (membrane-fusion protein)